MRLSLRSKRIGALAAMIGVLSGCGQSDNKSGQSTSNNASNPPSGTQSKADASAQFQVEPLPKSGASNANWGADKGTQSATPSFTRGRLLDRGRDGSGGAGGGKPAARPVDPFVAQYGKDRLEKAAVIRNYAHVSVMPVGIDAFVKTAWTGGNVHVRLALLGPLENLKTFCRTQNDVKLTFQDHAGNPLQVMIVQTSDLKLAPQGVNFGTPTYVIEGSMDCPLELYEEYYQWMFEWE